MSEPAAKPWTVQSFCELLNRHGTLGPDIKVRKTYNVCVERWINMEALVEELNSSPEEVQRLHSGERSHDT